MEKTSTKYSFDNGRGETLAGIIDAPAGVTPRLFGVFAPCFTCVKESHGAVKICRALAERGIAMLRFDMTGLGQSQGDFAATNFTTRIADIVAAANALAASHGMPRLLVGHSISGTAALSAIHRLPAIELAATVGSPADPQASIKKFYQLGMVTERDATDDIDVMGKMVHFRKTFIKDMMAQDVAGDTARIDRKLYVFQAPNDDIAGYANAETIVSRAPDAELVRLPDAATHLLEKAEGTADAALIADKISAFFFD